MLYEHYLIKPYDDPGRGTGKLKDWLHLRAGKETCQEETGWQVKQRRGTDGRCAPKPY